MTATPSRMDRVPWIDTGRGIAILLVALYHAANWLAGAGFDIPYWVQLNEVLSSMRMPLFFALAGLFAPKWLLAPWRDLWNVKLRLFAWVFLLWEVIGSVIFFLGLTMAGQGLGVRDTLVDLLVSPLMPRFELWFIWALSIFFVVAKLTRRVDVRVQLVVTGAVSMVALSGWHAPNVGWSGAAKYYFFFLAGLYLRSLILRFGSQQNRGILVAAVAAWLGVSVTLSLLGLREVFGLYFLNCLIGVLGGIAFSRMLSGVPRLASLGRNTLPVYLAHTPMIIILSGVLSLALGHPLAGAIAPALPVVLAAVAVALALALHRGAVRTRLRLLYEPPPGLFVARREVPSTSSAGTGS